MRNRGKTGSSTATQTALEVNEPVQYERFRTLFSTLPSQSLLLCLFTHAVANFGIALPAWIVDQKNSMLVRWSISSLI